MAAPNKSSSAAPNASRPTLPPLRSLCLPGLRDRTNNINAPAMNLTNNGNSKDLLPPLPLDFNQNWPRGRQSSVSSTTSSGTSSSRASSPTDAWPARRPAVTTRVVRRHHPYFPSDKYRVLLSNTYEDADAMLVVPIPPDVVDENNKPIPEKLAKCMTTKKYLVLGPLAKQLREPQNRALLRAVVHPYKFVLRNPPTEPTATPTPTDTDRRASTSSETSDSEMSAQ